MTENTSSGGGNTGLAFIVGGLLVVVVVIIAFFVFGRGVMPDTTKEVTVDVNLPKAEAPAVPTAG